MKSVKVYLDQSVKEAEIHVFSDWHIGDSFCNLAEIKEQINEVKEKENAYVICNGDLINNATKTSVSDCYAEEMPPMEQIEMLVALLSPIRDKILMLTQGNHEARSYRTDGIDLTGIVAKQLNLSERYVREGGILFLRIGEDKRHTTKRRFRSICYTFYVTHGSGGGRKEGAKAIRLADLAGIVDADIYIHGHTHLPMIMKESFYRTDLRNSCVLYVDKLFVNTSSNLDYGGYGQRYGYKPSSKCSPVIYLSGMEKKFNGKL